MNRLPIGVFDSGLGGLTVYRQLRDLLPAEDILYLGDTARVPYGSKSPATIIRFSSQIAAFLLEKKVKLIVVACNTASSLALETLKAASPVPVLGVIEAGVRTALEHSGSGRMAVIGTQATINSGSYPANLKILNADAEMTAFACPLFVPLVEEGWTDHPASALIAAEYLTPVQEAGVDTVILGCTHYPIMEDLIRKVLPSSIQIINPSLAAARSAADLLRAQDLLNPGPQPGKSTFFVTDVPAKFHDLSKRFLGYPLTDVEYVSVEHLEKYSLLP